MTLERIFTASLRLGEESYRGKQGKSRVIEIQNVYNGVGLWDFTALLCKMTNKIL
jgi:hypothetical protein